MAQIITTNSWGWSWGGGTSYTAWNWIDITSNEISIDEAVVQTVGNMVDNLTWADDDHYPTAKAVADAISGWGSWDVVWPASSTDWDIVLFDWATWKIIKDSWVWLSSKLDASALSNNNYWWAWQGDSTHTPTKWVLYDKIHTMDVEIWNKAADTAVVKLTWNQTINGEKTFWTSPVVPSKTTDATNTWTAIATEAQVYNVEQKIPSVIDDLTSTSSTSALSANQGKVLDDKIAALFWLWKFLSLWDATTWQPMSFPYSTPYNYSTWDYYLVEVIWTGTNYRPDWASYWGTASTTLETDELEIWDMYIYDWQIWLLQINHGKTVSFANLSWQPSDNANLASALNAKADTTSISAVGFSGDYDDLLNKPSIPAGQVQSDWNQTTTTAVDYIKNKPTIPTDTNQLTNWAWYITSSYHDSSKQDVLTAGTGIGISSNTISNTWVTSVNGSTWAVTVQDTLESWTNIKTINWNSILWSGNISLYSTITVTLTSAWWSSSTQTVSATGVTASNTVIVSPAPSSFSDYVEAWVYASSQWANSLTFTCTSEPAVDILVNVLIMD